GTYQPEPFLDCKTRVYHLALTEDGPRSPFTPPDETEKKADGEKEEAKDQAEVTIDLPGLAGRLHETPVPPGNYDQLTVTDKALFWLSTPAGEETGNLQALTIGHDKPEVKTVAEGVKSFEVSADGKKLLFRKGDDLHVVEAAADKADLDKT